MRDFRQNRDEAFPVRQRRLTFERIADLLGDPEHSQQQAGQAFLVRPGEPAAEPSAWLLCRSWAPTRSSPLGGVAGSPQ